MYIQAVCKCLVKADISRENGHYLLSYKDRQVRCDADELRETAIDFASELDRAIERGDLK